MGWARYSPEEFIYSAKLPKLITHEKRLDPARGVETDLQKFLELMEPVSLGGKLGCVLIQLPPRFSLNPQKLESFFEMLPTHVRFAVEFRDVSWMRQETWSLLEKYNVAYTVVDEPLLPPEIHLTSDIAYFRWHGRGAQPWYYYNYQPQELEPWIPKVKEVAGKIKKVYGYFNNHFRGYAVRNCLQMLEGLGDLTPEQSHAKQKVENYFKTVGALKETKLEPFVAPQMEIESLLLTFMDMGRLERAKGISDGEVKIEKQTEDLLAGKIKEYHFLIDSKAKTITHDCDDWIKGTATKRFCKHMGKLFLSMNKEQAQKLLGEISKERDEWQFKSSNQT
jgi:uncharacterized protein YecE (DUF72 family)